MLTYAVALGIEHPFAAGLIIGCLFALPSGILGWLMGYEAAMRKVRTWIRNRPPGMAGTSLPLQRDRRHVATTPGRQL